MDIEPFFSVHLYHYHIADLSLYVIDVMHDQVIFFCLLKRVPCPFQMYPLSVSLHVLELKEFTKIILFSRKQFKKICKREVEVPGITIMRDVAIAKSEFVPDQKAVTKIQTWHEDDVLWEYCCLPEVRL